MAGNIMKCSRPVLLITAIVLLYGCCKDCKFPLDNSYNPNDVRVYPADEYEMLFSHSGAVRIRGYGGISLKLSDGRIMWLLWETMIKITDSANGNHTYYPTLDNAIAIQDWNNLTILYGGTPDSVTAYLIPPDSGFKYYPLNAIETDDAIQVVCAKIEDYSSFGYLSYAVKSIDVVSLSKNDLAVTDITRKISSTRNLFGTGFIEDGGYLYIYGTRDDGLVFARTTPGSLLNQWEYKNGIGWSTDPDQAISYSSDIDFPVFMDVFKKDNEFYTVIRDDRYDQNLYLIKADRPTGEWTRVKEIIDSRFLNIGTLVYDAIIHWDLGTPEEVLMSVNSYYEDPYGPQDEDIHFFIIENLW